MVKETHHFQVRYDEALRAAMEAEKGGHKETAETQQPVTSMMPPSTAGIIGMPPGMGLPPGPVPIGGPDFADQLSPRAKAIRKKSTQSTRGGRKTSRGGLAPIVQVGIIESLLMYVLSSLCAFSISVQSDNGPTTRPVRYAHATSATAASGNDGISDKCNARNDASAADWSWSIVRQCPNSRTVGIQHPSAAVSTSATTSDAWYGQFSTATTGYGERSRRYRARGRSRKASHPSVYYSTKYGWTQSRRRFRRNARRWNWIGRAAATASIRWSTYESA